MELRLIYWLSILQFTLTCAIAGESPAPSRDGSHDFDFLIGNWKAHVRRLPDRLVGSNYWIEYNGIANHKKLLESNANVEGFESIIRRSSYTSSRIRRAWNNRFGRRRKEVGDNLDLRTD